MLAQPSANNHAECCLCPQSQGQPKVWTSRQKTHLKQPAVMGSKHRSPAAPTQLCCLLAGSCQQLCAAHNPSGPGPTRCGARVGLSRHKALGEPTGEVFQSAALVKASPGVDLEGTGGTHTCAGGTLLGPSLLPLHSSVPQNKHLWLAEGGGCVSVPGELFSSCIPLQSSSRDPSGKSLLPCDEADRIPAQADG